MLKYRNEDLLNALCDWVAKEPENLRPQEICSLLMTLATLGYCPDNFTELYKVHVTINVISISYLTLLRPKLIFAVILWKY